MSFNLEFLCNNLKNYNTRKNTESNLTPSLCANSVALEDNPVRNFLKIKWTLKKKNFHDLNVYN